MLYAEWRAGPEYITGSLSIFIVRLAIALEVENGETKQKVHHIKTCI
jgi:hypothetical protein